MKNKTKTQQLYEKCKPGTTVWVIVFPSLLEDSIAKKFSTQHSVLCRAKVVSAINTYKKTISLQLDISGITYTYFDDALNQIFLDREGAVKKYSNLLVRYRQRAKRILKEIEQIKENDYVINE